MTLLAPLALLGAIALPIVALFYLFKARRTEREISSILLWETLRRDLAAREPWQKLRWSVLLVLQLILLALLTVALARPAMVAPAPATRFDAIIVDTSASMRATDVRPDRLAQAISGARQLAAGLPNGTNAALITAGPSARVVVPETSDHGAIERGLDGLQGSDAAGDSINAALRLAAALARGRPGAAVDLFSDGAYPHPAEWDQLADLTLRFHQIGGAVGNRAITALAMSGAGSGGSGELFARVNNFATRPARINLTLNVDGRVAQTRTVDLAANQSQPLFFTNVPASARVIQLRIDGSDALAADNQATLVQGSPPTTSVLMVTDGNLFLQKALQAVPGLMIYQVTPRSFPAVNVAPYGVLVFDGFIPDHPPLKNSLIVDPSDAPWLPMKGVVRSPPITLWRSDDPTLAYVDLRDVRIARASDVTLPDWAQPLIESNGVPLGFTGTDDGQRIVGLTFDLRQSNLPLTAAFPILISNVIHYLLPPAVTQSASLAPGAPAMIPVQPGVDRIAVAGPASQRWTLTPAGQSVRFTQTSQTGLYQATEYVGSQAVATHRFAVNLFSASESDPRPRAGLSDHSAPAAASPGRLQLMTREYAPWLLLLAIPLLVGEWWWFHRR